MPGPAAPITLSPHPALPAAEPLALIAAASLGADGLKLAFRLSGAAAVRLPPPQRPGPADELWQHTCCEAFVASADSLAYREFNFSPSGQWAVYDFTDYRCRDTSFRPALAPAIVFQRLPDGFLLQAVIPAELLPSASVLHLGLTAVIEAADGDKSYWAPSHCAAQPDFHLRNSFTVNLGHP